MIYIHRMASVSTQVQLLTDNERELKEPVDNVFKVIEPKYEGIPLSILRRMGKAVRMGVGAALPLLKGEGKSLNGILIGTANGGMEDCIKFLNQVIEFEEGTLTPTNFVQSTPNAIAAQLSLLSENKGYNITHVNRGLAFENAVLDVWMLLKENPDHAYLLGGVEEISSYNYNVDNLAGWFKKENIQREQLYSSRSDGTLSGEGAALFVVSAEQKDAVAAIASIRLLHTDQSTIVVRALTDFLKQHLPQGEHIDVFLSGESGDERTIHYFEQCEAVLTDATVARFKHFTGDYATVSAMALTIATELLQKQQLPAHMIKIARTQREPWKNILIYNNYKGLQHSFMLVKSIS